MRVGEYFCVMKIQLMFLGIVCCAWNNLHAEKVDSVKRVLMPQIEIVTRKTGLMEKLPGSFQMIHGRELQQMAPVSANEVLRRLPGVHVVDEEGSGLRLNVSIRGLNPDRSRNVLVLEDGIPLSLNPYGESEMYYSPSIERMSSVEVLKGSGQLLYGPQTVGGVINFVTANPSLKPSARIRTQVGSGGFASTLLSYSRTDGNVSWIVNYLYRRADQLAHAGFRSHDVSSKIKIKFSERSSVGIKLAYYNEWSNATYLGLTQTMYDRGGQDFVRMAPDDHFDIRRVAGSVSHQMDFSRHCKLQSTAFAYTTSRDWQRQEFSSSAHATQQTGVIWGDTTVAGGAVYMRNLNAHRNRDFRVTGVQSNMIQNHQLGRAEGEFTVGFRVMKEWALEQRLNGSFAAAPSGALVEDEQRNGLAGSLYAVYQLSLSKQWSINAGVRYEHYRFEREVYRNTFMIQGASVLRDTFLRSNDWVQALLPGLGFNYTPGKGITFFGGLHRGFAPPRIKDAISKQGEVYQLDAEKSWNSEVGIRSHIHPSMTAEITLFSMNFANQVIPVSESSGGTGSGLVNGGATLHKGVEANFNWQIGKSLKAKYILDWRANVTWIDASFSGNRYVMDNQEMVNIIGNKTPYTPEYVLGSSVVYQSHSGYGIQASVTALGKQYGDVLNTELASADGRNGVIGAYRVVDLNLFRQCRRRNMMLNLAIKNIANERYIVSRRPQGIRVGMPRMLIMGVDFRI